MEQAIIESLRHRRRHARRQLWAIERHAEPVPRDAPTWVEAHPHDEGSSAEVLEWDAAAVDMAPMPGVGRIVPVIPQNQELILPRHIRALSPGAGKVNVVDIESELLDNSILSPDERASVLLRRSEWFTETADLKRACQDLLSARDQAHDDMLRGRIQATLRKALLRLGDDALIEQRLLNVPLPEDAFAYCRRGADALLSRGRNAAAGWYSEARNVARTGDEKMAAIMGLLATEDTGDLLRLRELDREWHAIPKEDCPKSQHVWSLGSDAGREVLRLARDGAMRQPFDSQAAVRMLREALDLADEMGWPKCPAAYFSTAADGFAYELLGLSLQEDSGLEQIQAGVALAIERGLMRLEKYFTVDFVESAASTPVGIAWVRDQVSGRPEAAYMARSRALLRSAFLVALPDEEIERHVANAFPGLDALELGRWDTSMSQVHASLLKNQLHWLPRKAVLHVVELTSRLLRSDTLQRDLLEDWKMPIVDWAQCGCLVRGDSAVVELIRSVTECPR